MSMSIDAICEHWNCHQNCTIMTSAFLPTNRWIMMTMIVWEIIMTPAINWRPTKYKPNFDMLNVKTTFSHIKNPAADYWSHPNAFAENITTPKMMKNYRKLPIWINWPTKWLRAMPLMVARLLYRIWKNAFQNYWIKYSTKFQKPNVSIAAATFYAFYKQMKQFHNRFSLSFLFILQKHQP